MVDGNGEHEPVNLTWYMGTHNNVIGHHTASMILYERTHIICGSWELAPTNLSDHVILPCDNVVNENDLEQATKVVEP